MAGIYVHIPFCKQACHYCDFYFSTSLYNKTELIDAICLEIELRKNYIQEPIETIYFGGGTPSLLLDFEFGKILNTIRMHFIVTDNLELTLEANPDDLSLSKLTQLRAIGFNRLSIGIQSFDDDDLKMMNRSHSSIQAIASLEAAQSAGFNNISIDLMYGLPQQTIEKWTKNLDLVSQLNVQHISCYCLTVEEKTALQHFIKTKKIIPNSENATNLHFEMLMDWAALNNFEHYEISNFAKPNFQSKHNSNYWHGKSYNGFGPSAHSYNGSSRQFNVKNNAVYIKNIAESLDFFEVEYLTEINKINEFILTQLRTNWGLSIHEFSTKFGNNILFELKEKLKIMQHNNWFEKSENAIILSGEGKFFADHIAAELFFE